MLISFDYNSIADYRKFLKLKSLPSYRWRGRFAEVPDAYAELFNEQSVEDELPPYEPSDFCFDYQRDISALAIRKRKFAAFVGCGLGKTIIMLECAKYASQHIGKCLIVSPLMVIPQTVGEAVRFYGDSIKIKVIKANELQQWLNTKGDEIGIVNYEAIRDGLVPGLLRALCLDESSLLKGHYGAWGTRLIELGSGLPFKLALTGTPAPNDRVEYANHAVFVDAVRTVNEFMAKYFVNRGETQNRWEIKPHALRPFYRDMSHWCIFLSNPSTYGWKDNCSNIPPINIHIDRIDLTEEQRAASSKLTGGLFVAGVGGIGQRSKLAQMAKGKNGMPTNKPTFIRNLVDSWPDESTIIWCRYNDEQDIMERTFPDAVSIRGETPVDVRQSLLAEFQSGQKRVIISKPKVMGFGLNLQIATRQVWSGLQDSYEEFHQGVKRSNRIGSTRPLNVHIPVTELEEPMIQTVLAKAHRVELDTIEQEREFKNCRFNESGVMK